MRIRALAGSLMLAALPALGATVYTNQAAFLAAIDPSYEVETFDEIPDGAFGQPADFYTTSYGFTVESDAYTNLWGIDAGGGDYWLSTDIENTYLTFTFYGDPTALGGYFFYTNEDGAVIGGTITLNLSDGTHVDLTDATSTTFTGFVTLPGVYITSLEMATSPGGAWPTVNDVYLGQALESASVPEPITALPLAGALIGLALLCRRRGR